MNAVYLNIAYRSTPISNDTALFFPVYILFAVSCVFISSYQEKTCGDERTLLIQSSVYDVEVFQSRITKLLGNYHNGLWLSKIPTVYREMFGQTLHPQVLKDLEKWTHICMVRWYFLFIKTHRYQGRCSGHPQSFVFFLH